MNKIYTIENEKELKELFNFLSRTFYDDSVEYKEHYFTMSERYDEIKKQYLVNKKFLMYIKEDNEIIAGITGKNMNVDKQSITLSMLAVDKKYRRKGLASKLVLEFEKKCLLNEIHHIDLGARYRACPLYKSLDYKYYLMIQVFDFVTIEDVKSANKYRFKELSSWQGETYGFISYKVDKISQEYIKYFEKKVPTAHAQYIFEKDI